MRRYLREFRNEDEKLKFFDFKSYSLENSNFLGPQLPPLFALKKYVSVRDIVNSFYMLLANLEHIQIRKIKYTTFCKQIASFLTVNFHFMYPVPNYRVILFKKIFSIVRNNRSLLCIYFTKILFLDMTFTVNCKVSHC